jgi:hypothetical protein
MVCNIERHDDDDQYSNGELVKYKKIIENSNKPWLCGLVHETVCDGETFLVEGEQRME